jgi:hypothetical protein
MRVYAAEREHAIALPACAPLEYKTIAHVRDGSLVTIA